MHKHERKIMARFQQLRVWHVANEILAQTYQIVATLRGETTLRDQMKRAAISIVSNIAEGSERVSEAEFRHFLSIARASAGELLAQYHIIRVCGLLYGRNLDAILDRIDHCIRMLSKFILRLAG
jgi:four helix bundle protein